MLLLIRSNPNALLARRRASFVRTRPSTARGETFHTDIVVSRTRAGQRTFCANTTHALPAPPAASFAAGVTEASSVSPTGMLASAHSADFPLLVGRSLDVDAMPSGCIAQNQVSTRTLRRNSGETYMVEQC